MKRIAAYIILGSVGDALAGAAIALLVTGHETGGYLGFVSAACNLAAMALKRAERRERAA